MNINVSDAYRFYAYGVKFEHISELEIYKDRRILRKVVGRDIDGCRFVLYFWESDRQIKLRNEQKGISNI